MALFVAVSLGTPGDEARVLFGVFAVAGLRLMPSVRNMMSGWSALKYNRYTIDILRDIDLNDEKPEPSAAQPPLPFEREIAVRDLSFRFDDERGDKEVLHGLTLTIQVRTRRYPRRIGGRKTTLFNLLLGFYTPTGGEITIDGEPLTAANRRRWQNAVGYVSQHVSPAGRHPAGKHRPGRRGGENRPSESRGVPACRPAGRLRAIALRRDRHPGSGEAGNKLSGGQRQHRHCQEPSPNRPIFFILRRGDLGARQRDGGGNQPFDRRTVMQHNRDLTIVVIAHRESSLEYCDRIITLDNNG